MDLLNQFKEAANRWLMRYALGVLTCFDVFVRGRGGERWGVDGDGGSFWAFDI